jgi:hypothetical protein
MFMTAKIKDTHRQVPLKFSALGRRMTFLKLGFSNRTRHFIEAAISMIISKLKHALTCIGIHRHISNLGNLAVENLPPLFLIRLIPTAKKKEFTITSPPHVLLRTQGDSLIEIS